jgi:hypothetical protein
MEVVQMEEINTNIKKKGRNKPNSIVAFMIHGGLGKMTTIQLFSIIWLQIDPHEPNSSEIPTN